MRINRPIRVAGVLAVMTCAVPAHSEESGAVLEQIIVTSRKFEESLQSAPVSVAAFTADALAQRSVDNISDIVAFTPNVSAPAGYSGGGDGFYFIRGIGQNDFTAALDPGVGTYLDGVYLGRTAGSTFDLLDIERIEVLRGPQGTLFGRNTIGGAINVVSARPSGELEGRASVVVGDRDRLEGKLSVDFPMGETLAGTVSMLSKEQDGFGRRLTDGATMGDVDTQAARAAFEWKPSDTFDALLSADYTRGRGTPAMTTSGGNLLNGGSPLAVPLPADLNDYITGNPETTNAGQPLLNDLDVWGAAATLTWDLGSVTLKSIAAYRDLEQESTADYDGSPYATYDDYIPIAQNQFSEELQLSGLAFDERVNWLVGAYYFNEEVDQTNAITLGVTGPGGFIPGPPISFAPLLFAVDPASPNDNAYRIISRQRILPEITAMALFGQASIKLTDRLSATLGLRYSDEEKEQAYDFYIDNTIPNHPFGFPIGSVPSVQTQVDESWNSVDPRLGLELQATDDVLLYVSYAEGFRSGGFNSRPLTADIPSFDPEEVASYEVGLKSEWFDRRVRVNAAAFYSDYENVQLSVNPPGSFFNIENAAQATIQGFELELTARPVDWLMLNFGAGYLDDELDELSQRAVDSGLTLNNELPMAPEWTANAGVQVTGQVGGLGTLSARVDYSYQDESYAFADNLPGNLMESYDLVNVRVTWRSPDEAWEVAAFGLNVLDEEYLRFAQDVRTNAGDGTPGFGTLTLWPGAPAEWGVELAYRF